MSYYVYPRVSFCGFGFCCVGPNSFLSMSFSRGELGHVADEGIVIVPMLRGRVMANDDEGRFYYCYYEPLEKY